MNSRCISACPSGQVAVEGVCKECSSPCQTCSGSTETCSTCIDKYLLFKSTCVDHCPDKYEANKATVNQCILVGLICPDGFHINADGEGCVPNEFECKEGYEINQKKTACIPKSGSPVPFPFIFTTICLGILVGGSYMKERKLTKVITCLIFLVGSLELIEYLTLAIHAASQRLFFISLLAFISVFFQLTSNILFVAYYQRETMADEGFSEWIRLCPKTKLILPIACVFLNFKVIRYVFSGFFGNENCLASFKDP